MRMLILLLILGNAVFFAWHQLFRETADPAAQIAQLQLSPEKIRPLQADSAPAVAPAPVAKATRAPAACIEWSSFAGADVARADAAVAALALAPDAVVRQVADVDGYWIHMPPLKTKPEVDRKLGELKALGVTEFFVVQEAGAWRNAISLGLFKNEEAANSELERMRQRGVRSAVVTRREGLLKQVSFFLRDPGKEKIARLTEVQREFSGAELKAVSCPGALPAK